METSKFDIGDYWDSKDMTAEHLNTVSEVGNHAEVKIAIGTLQKVIINPRNCS